jgi:hypothetical protein
VEQIVETIYTLIDDSRNVEYITVTQAGPQGKLWTNVEALIDDCKTMVGRLKTKVNGVHNDSIFGRWMTTKAITLNDRMREIILYKSQIHIMCWCKPSSFAVNKDFLKTKISERSLNGLHCKMQDKIYA